MKRKFPVHSYPWYVQDWHNSMSRMTMDLETRAFYRELLDYCVTEGPFPEDPKILAAIALCSEDQAARLWPKVQPKFTLGPKGWFNRKASDVRDLIQVRKGKISDSRKQRGPYEKSPRDLKDDSLRSSREHRDQEGEGDGEGEGDVVLKKKEVPQIPRGYSMDVQYEDFRNACKSWGMNIVDPEDFYDSWWEWVKLDGLQRADSIAGLLARKEAGVEAWSGLRPKNYLRSREWKRAIKLPKQSGLTAEEIAAL